MRPTPPLLFSLLVACWLLALPGWGQVLPRAAYDAALKMIRDSTEMARQAMDLRRPKPRRALRIADAVLRRYPLPIGWQDTTGAAYDTPHVIYAYDHPWRLYLVRARWCVPGRVRPSVICAARWPTSIRPSSTPMWATGAAWRRVSGSLRRLTRSGST